MSRVARRVQVAVAPSVKHPLYTIWPDTALPVNASAQDPGTDYTLGVKFTADLDGWILGLRFYKGDSRTGVNHVGGLWRASDQALLGQLTFANETDSGWQNAYFTTPIQVTAGTLYIASYVTNQNYFAISLSGLVNAVDNPPLHALSSGSSGGNGCFAVSTVLTYPNQSSNSSNYYVDVLFSTAPNEFAYPSHTNAGEQLISQLKGVHTNVGPNALLHSSTYPLPGDASSGPLTTVTPPADPGYWRIDGSTEQGTICAAWSSPTQAYVYNDDPSNLGGIVPAGGMTIDGFTVPAGTYVFQFMDISAGTFYLTDSTAPSVLFRGCRARGGLAAPGYFNTAVDYAGSTYFHYCDIGGTSGLIAGNVADVGIKTAAPNRTYRCYVSYVTTGVQANNLTQNEAIENYIEKITLSTQAAHLNGIMLNGGETCALIKNNHIVIETPDELGNNINQTDCIGLFQDFGTLPGTGTNVDGSSGYAVMGNYVGGTGYCFYLGTDNSQNGISNLNFAGNLVTTAIYPTGGFNGPAAYYPVWNSSGNMQSDNFWADGSTSGLPIFG